MTHANAMRLKPLQATLRAVLKARAEESFLQVSTVTPYTHIYLHFYLLTETVTFTLTVVLHVPARAHKLLFVSNHLVLCGAICYYTGVHTAA
jgi:hypothetical protein